MFCYISEIYMNDSIILINRDILISNSVYILKLLRAYFKC